MSSIPEGEWDVVCSAEVFSTLRHDREFAFLVTVARIVNAVKFGVQAHREAGVDRTPIAERQRIGAQLFLAGLLHEILEFKRASANDWGDSEAYTSIFGFFDESRLDDKTVELLHRIRNRTAFHFDAAVASRALPQLPAEPFTFIAAVGRNPMNSNYELADLVTFGFIFGAPADVHKLAAGLAEFRPKLDSLLLDFVRTADQFLLKRLLARGFTIEERPPGSFAADRTG
jgi:hypothetical protein